MVLVNNFVYTGDKQHLERKLRQFQLELAKAQIRIGSTSPALVARGTQEGGNRSGSGNDSNLHRKTP